MGTSFQSVINVTNTSGEFLGSVSAEAQHQLRNGAVCLETNAYRIEYLCNVASCKTIKHESDETLNADGSSAT